uniref:biotin--[acetyl-CoA-carboxylase] ligase n=1 Tax=Alloprevotella sp. TaxID=1872471 RepID=UPI004027285F
LLFSFVFHPTLIPAFQQFALSEALALGIRAALLSFVGEGITVKWPNDIYWQDKKIAGMLLTHTLCGATIATTLTGVGLNVNQRTFISDAPNPISLRQIIGKDVPRHQVLEALLQAFELRYRQIQQGDYDALHQEYMQCLYCGKGLHTYEDAAGRFQASIQHISSTGMLHLKRADGVEKVYAFKEVKLIN